MGATSSDLAVEWKWDRTDRRLNLGKNEKAHFAFLHADSIVRDWL
jgi:hypothetical protein